MTADTITASTAPTGQAGCCGPDCGCSGETDSSATVVKPLTVDFLYLDLNICERCVATGDTLDEALEALAPALGLMSYQVSVNKVNIATAALAQQYRFVSSPTIRVNGVEIGTGLQESHCSGCSDLSGCSTNCRVFVFDGQEYEQPPAPMIALGLLKILTGAQSAPEPAPYVMPDNLVNYFNGRESKTMRKIDVFEPAMCCNTGVCGPDPAQELVSFTGDLEYLKSVGVDITRHNLANDPQVFAHTDPVRDFLVMAGSEGLPLVLVDGAVVLTGRYPSRSELERYAGVAATPTATGCCGGQDTTDASCGCGSAPAEQSSCGCGTQAQGEASVCCPPAEPAAASAGCGCGSSGCC